MSTTLVIALLIPWVFWGALMGLLFVAGRSWINFLIFPVVLTVMLLFIANLTSVGSVFRASLILHGTLLVFIFWSYVSFVVKVRR